LGMEISAPNAQR